MGKEGQKVAPKWVAPEDEQEMYESRRCVSPFFIFLSFAMH